MNDETRKSSRYFLWIVFAICVSISVYGYVSVWPLWSVLLLLFFIPAISVSLCFLTGRFRRYRMLFIIFGLSSLIGSFEAWQHKLIPDSLTESLSLPPGPGEPDLNLQYDFPGTLIELYPDRSEILFVRAHQLKLCNDNSKSYYRYHICFQVGAFDLATIRDHFERALQKNSKTDENLHYEYVGILISQGAPQDEIDDAAEKWRHLFPYSKRQDPREAYGIESPPP